MSIVLDSMGGLLSSLGIFIFFIFVFDQEEKILFHSYTFNIIFKNNLKIELNTILVQFKKNENDWI